MESGPTPEELQKLRDTVAKAKERFDELAKIGTSPETPDEGELLTHGGRAASGFAEDQAIVKMTNAGFTDMHRNKAGDWVAKGPDQRWYSDSHGPVSFIERHLGDVPGFAGMAGGAAAGTVAGGAVGAFQGAPGGVPGMAAGALAYAPYGAAAGAGAGAAGGEALRQYIGKKLGVREGVDGGDVAVEGVLGALGEGFFQGVPRIPVGGGKNVGKLLSEIADKYAIKPVQAVADKYNIHPTKVPAWVAGKLSGSGTEAAQRVLDRPAEMLAAHDNINAKAEKAGDYLNFQDRVYGADSSDARVGLQRNHGDKIVDTHDLLGMNADAMERYAPNALGEGPLSPEEWDLITKRQKASYATEVPIYERKVEKQPQWKNTFQVEPEIKAPIYERKVIPTGKELETLQPAVEYSPLEPRMKLNPLREPSVRTQVSVKQKGTGLLVPGERMVQPDGQALLNEYGTRIPDTDLIKMFEVEREMHPTLGKGKVSVTEPAVEAAPFKTKWVPSGDDQVIKSEVRANPLNMQWARSGEAHLPQQTLGSLQRTADELAKDVGPANWKRAVEDKPAQRSTSYTSEAKKQYHAIKDVLHMEDGNLARADKQYSDFARSAEPIANLSAPLKREKEYNAIAKAIAEGTDEEKIKAAQAALPGHMDDLMDTGLSNRFDKYTSVKDLLNPLKPRRMLQLGMGAGSYAAGQANPELEFGLGAGALLLEPSVVKNLLARYAQAAPKAAAAAARGAELKSAQSIWSLFNQEKKDGKD